uniref:NADH-ubiquinone oxidoreductase chain 4 n=1 Tax=Sinergasilus undulatus TaxID=232572 RepID=A0A873ADW7_9MAXI|nr:NADH dehydrogenase subunit 4 [Sinergasilus undulatus]QOY46117.1 NADH dehydrogenase subunit 4 [Sinergasilus undulatus]
MMNLISILFILMLTTIALLMSKEMSILISVIMLTFLLISSDSLGAMVFIGDLVFMDSYSFSLILLTLLIFMMMPTLSVLLEFNNLNLKIKLMNILQMILIMIFVTTKSLTFYMLFELSLIPIFLIIAGWGYQFERLSAGAALIMYTVTASLPLLICIVWVNLNSKVVFMQMFNYMKFNEKYLMFGVLLMVMISFLVKLPIFLGHLWLPKAHVEAPASGSMILAAILLKLGGYGMLRFIPLFNSNLYLCIVVSLALWGGVLSALICIQGLDLKIIVAYSSIAHMAMVISALFVMSQMSVSGALLLMIAHGFSSSGLFLWVGIFSKYSNSRSLILNKSLISTNPTVCTAWFLVLAAGMGIPPSLNFWSELISVISICSDSWVNSLPCALLIFLAGAYTLLLYAMPTHSATSFTQNKKILTSPPEMLLGFNHVVWSFLLVIILDLIC